VALATPAFGQTPSNKAAAEALFIDGRNLMAQGKHAEACRKFEASQNLEPGIGTMLNLAQCYEATGRTASAWAQYREAIPLARAAGSREREDFATERSKALESRLSTLTIRAMSGVALSVRRDGVAVDAAELGTPIPVDPGPHQVEASAPGKAPWSTTVEVTGDAARVSVDIPQLDEAPSGGTPPPSAAPAASPDSGNQGGSIQKPLAIGIAAVGLVGLGVGTYFGLSAGSKWDDAKAACRDYPYECSPQALDHQSSASSQATVSTVAFIAGGVAIAAGAVLWLTAGSGEEKTAVGVGPGNVFVKGRF
jgi:hypothetical protein